MTVPGVPDACLHATVGLPVTIPELIYSQGLSCIPQGVASETNQNY